MLGEDFVDLHRKLFGMMIGLAMSGVGRRAGLGIGIDVMFVGDDDRGDVVAVGVGIMGVNV